MSQCRIGAGSNELRTELHKEDYQRNIDKDASHFGEGISLRTVFLAKLCEGKTAERIEGDDKYYPGDVFRMIADVEKPSDGHPEEVEKPTEDGCAADDAAEGSIV